jgi:hypothetical protein
LRSLLVQTSHVPACAGFMNFQIEVHGHSPGTVHLGELLGFPGLLLAIPLTCLGIAHYRRYVLPHMEASAGANSPPGFPP